MAECQCGCGEDAGVYATTDPRPGKNAVKGEPKKFKTGHHLRRHHRMYEPDPETGCWIWMWSRRGTFGYGGYRPGDGKYYYAHRWMWEQKNGPVPDGLFLDHVCCNPGCVNPDHLEPVTMATNLRRGRSTKLTMEQAEYIRRSDRSPRELAARYDVSIRTIYNARSGRTFSVA